MKKTLIAAGIAAVIAAPAAFADVSVSGQVKWTMTDGGTKGSETRSMGSDNAIDFKVSEDLGNGLTAFAQITLDTDADTDTTASSTAAVATTGTVQKDAKAGIKGAFGTIVYGRMETLSEGVASAKMDDGRSTHTNAAGGHNLESGITALGRVNAIAYISPTVNGFHAAIAGTSVSNSETFSDVDVLVAYDNGPLSLMATYADLDATNGAFASALTYNSVATTMTGAYTMGDAKVSVQRVNLDPSTGADSTDMVYRLDYKMGNNSILVGHKNAELSDDDVTTVKLTHNFSKQTAVYAGWRDIGASAEANDIFVGALHKF
jgi:predicted porin